MEEKKKGGKLKKIIIAILAVVIIAAIVIGVLIATGKLDINLTKKSKMVAGVEKLGEAITDPIDAIVESAEKNGTKVKVLENIKKDSPVEISTEVSANIDDLTIENLSSSERSTLKSVIDIVNDSKIGLDFKYDGDKSVYAKIDGSVDSASISGELVYDGEQAGIRSEELNEKWLTISEDDLIDLLKESGLDIDDLNSTMSTSTEQMEKLAEKFDIDEKTQDEIAERYEKVLKDYIDEKSKDIETEKDKVEVDGKDKSCTKLTLELDDDDLKDLLKAYVKTFGKDKQVREILESSVEAVAEIAKEAGAEDEIDVDELLNSIDMIYENIEYIEDSIDEIEFDGKAELIVYATTTNVYRTDIIIEAEGEKLKFETTYNKNSTVMDISYNSIDVASITLTSTDNEIGLKVELSKTLAKTAMGGECYFEIKYKNSSSKSEMTVDVKAGNYGTVKVSAVTDINKNDDKEYSDTTTVSIDADIPNYVTAKMSITVKTSIKIGDISIPSISAKDSVEMTDGEAVEEYGKEAQENAEKLLKEFSEVKSLEPLLEDVIDEIF